MPTRYKVLISDPLPADARSRLEESEHIEVLEIRENLEAVLPEIHAWIVRSGTQIKAESFELTKNLRCICRAGAGVDNIDLEAATRHGVVVMNTPGSNSIAAAEHTVALLLALARNIPFAHASLGAGRWNKKDFVGVEVEGKELGIIGLGKVGRIVARKARGLGMQVSGFDPFVSPEVAGDLGIVLRAFEDILTTSDFLVLHTPLTDATRGLLGAREFGKCRPGVRIVNCSRGGVVDESALLEAIEAGQVAGAALDVFAREPLPEASPLRNHPRIVITPHLGASTVEAQLQVAAVSGDQVRDFLLEGTVVNAVNTVSLAGSDRERFTPLVELARRLGSFQAQVLAEQPSSFHVLVESEANDDTLERLVVDSALEGFLGETTDLPVNTVNARYLAQQHGLDVSQARRVAKGAYTSLVRIEIETPTSTRAVAGAVVGERALRVVSFDDYAIDGVLAGPLLLTVSDDQPGMVGRLGTLLGRHKLNIANLSLGRDQQGGTALAIFNLDTPAPLEVVEELRNQPGIMRALSVKMPDESQ